MTNLEFLQEYISTHERAVTLKTSPKGIYELYLEKDAYASFHGETMDILINNMRYYYAECYLKEIKKEYKKQENNGSRWQKPL